MQKIYKSLVINPGSTSTKIAVFNNYELIYEENIIHSYEDLLAFKVVLDQKEYRKQLIINSLKNGNINLATIDYFIGRGGLLRPLLSGTYEINHKMIDDLYSEEYGSHAANFGAILAFEFAQEYNKKAYTVDPVVVDELSDIARVSGQRGINRRSIFHALNHKAIAKQYANSIGIDYQKLNLIVAHLGGGISVGLHLQGRVVDVNDALGGEGPLSPERSGGLPVNQIIDLCYSKKYSKDELYKRLVGSGGLVSYLGTNDGRKIRQMIYAGDKKALYYLSAMSYQIAKEIGGLYFAAKGKVDAVLLTGGSAYNEILVDQLQDYLGNIVKVVVIPGEDEMSALVSGVLRTIKGEEQIQEY